MALYKIPNAEALNGTSPLSASIIPNEGHAKYVCLDPWINAIVTLASLGTIIAFLMVRCRKRTLCRGLEYATACRSGPHHEHPAEHHTYHDEEDTLVHRDLQRSGWLEDMPEDDRTGPLDRPTRSPNNPPTYEEALHSLGRAPTVADLGLHRPDSCSSSLVPYDEDSNPEEDQDQLEVTPDQMETEDPATAEAPVKKGMGIAAGPGNYQPARPRYVRANGDSEDGQDTNEEGDIEAPYLAPKQNPVPNPCRMSKQPKPHQKAKTSSRRLAGFPR